jgi:GDP-D-mannose dehydratase
MPKSDKLNELLNKGTIKRGKGFTLSTEEQPESALVHKSTSAEEQKSTNALVHQDAAILRPSKGFKLRTDVADACKLLAAQQKRKLYEVMEEALIEYLQKHGVDIR